LLLLLQLLLLWLLLLLWVPFLLTVRLAPCPVTVTAAVTPGSVFRGHVSIHGAGTYITLFLVV
jgi:hypothetical protein